MKHLTSAVIMLLAAAIPLAATANGNNYPPSRTADLAALPPAPPLGRTACAATGTWFETGGYSGNGSWGTKAKLKCKIAGVWTDAFGYTWTIRKLNSTTLKGTVNYNNLADCASQVWLVAGTIGKRQAFTVTATNPTSPDAACVEQFGYNLTIQ